MNRPHGDSTRAFTTSASLADSRGPAIQTNAVYVVFTSVDDTLRAVRIAHQLAHAMGAPLTLVHFRAVPYPLAVDRPVDISPVETDEFLERVQADRIDLRVRVFLCRDARPVIPTAFRPHSVVVVAGRRSWWPTPAERLRRRLEAAGHFVVFVDTAVQKERSHA